MSRFDRLIGINQILTCGPKNQKNENASIDVQTNTDPWCPKCQTCLQARSSKFVFVENTIDMNEYMKALDYINAVHGLINESLLSKSEEGKCCNLNLKADISMPDLPNFLSILSSINYLRNNNVTPSCQNISKTTSTTSLPVYDMKAAQTEELTKHEDDGLREELPNIEQSHGDGDQCSHTDGEEAVGAEIYEEDRSEDNSADGDQCTCTCKHCSKLSLRHEKHDNSEVQGDRLLEDTKEPELDCEGDNSTVENEQNIDLKRKKGTPEISMCYHHAKKTVNKCRPYEPVLSDAELDRYATELLVDGDWKSCALKSVGDAEFTMTVPITKHPRPESSNATKPRIPQIPEQGVKKKPVAQKIRDESPPPVKLKPTTQIPVKQSPRPNSVGVKKKSPRSCSPPKKAPSPTRTDSPVRGFKPPSLISITPPKIMNFQLPSLTTLEKKNIYQKQQGNTKTGSSTSVVAPKHKKSDKKAYKIVQQREDDDFIYARKPFRTYISRQFSENLIMPGNDEQINVEENELQEYEINGNMQKAFTFQSKGSRHSMQRAAAKSSQNFVEDAEDRHKVVSDERFVVSIPTQRRKRDLRNKPFRQARRESCDSANSGDIVRFKNHRTPYKQMQESDTNSNDSGSSDIKSDKESPYRLGFKIPPVIVNYSDPSRDPINQHKL